MRWMWLDSHLSHQNTAQSILLSHLAASGVCCLILFPHAAAERLLQTTNPNPDLSLVRVPADVTDTLPEAIGLGSF